MPTLKAAYVLVAATLACAESPKVSPDLKPGSGAADVIVQYTEMPGPAHHAKVAQRGGRLKLDLSGKIKAAAYTMPSSAIQDLARDPDVVYISPDRAVRGSLDTAAAAARVDVPAVAGWTGKGIGIAVIDSGVSDHWDLRSRGNGPNRSRIVYSESFVGAGTAAANSAANDAYGHGTHVAGIIAGDGWSSTGPKYTRTLRGVAPGSHIVNLRVLDDRGQGSDSAVIAAISRAIDLAATYNIRVINLSIGRPVFESFISDPLCQAAEAAWKAGIVVVAAAGNEGRNNSIQTAGYGTITSPGNDPYVITVGAMKSMRTPGRADDLIASYSSKGPTAIDHVLKPDLVAPGNQVASLLYNTRADLVKAYPANNVPYSYYQSTGNPNASYVYLWLNGTSMAAPVVSGAAALMLEKDGSLRPDQVKARLMKTASKSFPRTSVASDPVTGEQYVSNYDIFTVGAGYLDVAAALSNSDSVPAGLIAVSPFTYVDPKDSSVRIVFDYFTMLVQCGVPPTAAALPLSAVWGSNGVWGSSAVWGASTVWGASVLSAVNTALFGSSAVWGSAGAAGYTAVWGAATPWSAVSQMSSANSALQVMMKGE